MQILLIGCNHGIGLEILKNIYNKTDNQIIALSKSFQEVDKIVDLENEIRLQKFEINLLNNSSISTVLELILEKNIYPDIVIYNAGILYNKKFTKFTDNEIDDIFKVNFLGYAKLLKILLASLPPKKVHFLSISSMAGIQGASKFPGLSFYSASKSALAALSESLAQEYKKTPFCFNTLALGSVQTKMLEQAFPGYKAPISASEMAEFITWFALNGHQFFNGKIIPVALSTP